MLSLEAKDAIINASSIFGKITIYVPENVSIKLISNPIFGSVTNQTKNKKGESETTLYINATCMFGGIEIR